MQRYNLSIDQLLHPHHIDRFLLLPGPILRILTTATLRYLFAVALVIFFAYRNTHGSSLCISSNSYTYVTRPTIVRQSVTNSHITTKMGVLMIEGVTKCDYQLIYARVNERVSLANSAMLSACWRPLRRKVAAAGEVQCIMRPEKHRPMRLPRAINNFPGKPFQSIPRHRWR